MKRFRSLKKNREFVNVYRSGSSRACGCLVMYIIGNGLSFNRLGVSASKKIGNSVVRHTFTRKIREIFRLNEGITVQGWDIVIVARGMAGRVEYNKLEKYYIRLLRDHNLLLSAPESDDGCTLNH